MNGIEKLFGIEIFSWDGWDDLDDDELYFYNIKFLLDSMSQYNGLDASLDSNGKLEIYKKHDYDDFDEVVYSDYIINIKEFYDKVVKVFHNTDNYI